MFGRKLNYKSTSLHVPTLEGPLVMISLLNAEMATVDWNAEAKHGRSDVRIFHLMDVRINAVIGSMWLPALACHGLFNRAFYCYYVYEQKVHCSTQMILKMHFVYCMRFIVILSIVVQFITTTKMRGHYLICFVEMSMNDYDFLSARWILMQKM